MSEIQGRPAGLELVNPDDLLPVVDISGPVYPWRPLSPLSPGAAYPSTPPPQEDEFFPYESLSPQSNPCPPSPQYFDSCPPSPQYFDSCPPSPQYPIEKPSPQRSPPAPATPPFNPLRSKPAPSTPPFNPLRSRPIPPPRAEPRPEPPRAPTPPRPIKKIKKRKAIATEQRQLRAEHRGKNTQRPKFCKLCKLSCNSAVSFANHVTSRKHQYRLSLPDNPLYCQPCDRHFPDTKQLEEHKRGNPHVRAVIAANRAKARR